MTVGQATEHRPAFGWTFCSVKVRSENTHRMPCALRRDTEELTRCGETGA